MNRNERAPFYILLLACYAVLGAMVLTINTTMPSVASEYGWSDAQGGLLITCLAVGNMVASLLTGILAARTGIRKALLLAVGMVLLSCGLYAVVPVPMLFYPLMVIAGFGWGGINNIVNTGVSLMYPGSTSRLNVGHACYAVCAVLFPLLAGFVQLRGGSWRVPVVVVAALALLMILPIARVPIHVAYRREAKGKEGLWFLKETGFYLGFAMFFLYVGVETAACAWLSEWLGRQNDFFRSVPSETMVSLMWLTMIIGRLGFAAVGTRVPKKILLLILTSGFLLGMLGVVFLSRNTVLSIISVAFMGLSMAAIYATNVANSTRYITSSLASGLIYAGAGLGGAVIPLLAGAFSDAYSLKVGMLALCVLLALYVALAFVNLIRKGEDAV